VAGGSERWFFKAIEAVERATPALAATSARVGGTLFIEPVQQLAIRRIPERPVKRFLMSNATTPNRFALTREEIARYHHDGFLGPFAMHTPEEMEPIRDRIHHILETDGPNPKMRTHSRHIDHRTVFDLVSHPAFLDRAESLLGPDLVSWTSNFFVKEPGIGKETPWHQDFNYWPIEPIVNMTAWMAIDETTTENSCVNLIPGSHKKIVPHISCAGDDGKIFGEMADPSHFDASKARAMELKAGEFFIFNERMLHQANPNRSSKRRVGLAMRITIPIVRIDHDLGSLFKGHYNLVVRGEDRMGFNRLGQPPSPRDH
jgi:hypothetical protein